MDITISSSFLPHDDPEASLAFYRDVLGFEVRMDVGYETMRWITVGPGRPAGHGHRAAPAGPSRASPRTRCRPSHELLAKGTYFGVNLATEDVDATFERLQANGADIVQEPIDQDYGVRDFAVRDPAGNMLRIQQSPVPTAG